MCLSQATLTLRSPEGRVSYSWLPVLAWLPGALVVSGAPRGRQHEAQAHAFEDVRETMPREVAGRSGERLRLYLRPLSTPDLLSRTPSL